MTSTRPSQRPDGDRGGQGGVREPAASRGHTLIADGVVQKIAGIAAREISGVHGLGAGAARAVGAIREKVPGTSGTLAQGVAVEVGERQAAVDLDLVAEYGVALDDLANAVRANVIGTVERMTGLQVTEVNITVDDIHLPGEDGQQAEPGQQEQGQQGQPVNQGLQGQRRPPGGLARPAPGSSAGGPA